MVDRKPFVTEGIREYLRELEKLPADHFALPTECNRLDDIKYMKKIVDASNQLRQYYTTEEKYPPLLKGEEFKTTHKVARGGQGSVVLAKLVNDEDEERYVLKTRHDRSEGKDRELLFEYMFQEQAHSLLKGSCTVPEPIGIIRQHAEPPYGYIMVARFVPLYPGASNNVILKRAAVKHRENPLLSLKDWRRVFLSLITAFETLQANDIYHNDVKSNNILLRFYENNIEPVIIDFGLATRSINHRKTAMNPDKTRSFYTKRPRADIDKERPYICPILYEEESPIATSDLYGVSYIIWFVGNQLQLPVLFGLMQQYRQDEPRDRAGFKSFFKQVDNAFKWEFCKGVEITLDSDREHAEGTEGKLITAYFKIIVQDSEFIYMGIGTRTISRYILGAGAD